MNVDRYKRFNQALFIYELYKDSYLIVSLLSSTLNPKIIEIIGYLYYPLFGFNFSSFIFFEVVCCVEVVLFIISCSLLRRMLGL